MRHSVDLDGRNVRCNRGHPDLCYTQQSWVHDSALNLSSLPVHWAARATEPASTDALINP